MRNVRLNRGGSALVAGPQRRVPLNTVILPPLSPGGVCEAQYLGQILVNNKTKAGEIPAAGRQGAEIAKNGDAPKGPEATRIAQLEQNIRFLQEQHQLMLNGLHQEVDSLRNRNRDLEFKLTFAKTSLPSSPSSSSEEDGGNGVKQKAFVSPKQPNVTPLQVEIMERELGELKIHLQEIESRNTYLSAIVDEQKKKLERYERDRERERERSLQPDQELLRKLDDAETLIRRLRHENSELRRDATTSASAVSPSNSPPYHHHHHRHHHHSQGGREGVGNIYHQHQNQQGNAPNQSRGNSRNSRGGNYRNGGGGGNWFPPLHSQSYWHQQQRPSRSGGEKNGAEAATPACLPSLQQPVGGVPSSAQYQQQPQQQSRRGNNNHHYHHNNGDGRKYRGSNNRGGGNKGA